MLKHVFLAHVVPVVTRFGPWKIPKCLENGPFWDQKWVINGSKTRFPKVIMDHLGCSNRCFLAHFEPVETFSAHGKSQNALKMGGVGTKKGSKMGQKRVFPKVNLDHLGCSNKCFWPILTPF